MKPFIERIAEDRPMLYDGGFGSQLFERGIELTNSTLANEEHPDAVVDIHRIYIEAGVDAIGSNTFVASELHLEMAGKDPAAAGTLATRAVELAQRAVSESEREVYVAGSIGPSPGAIESDAGDTTFGIADVKVRDAHARIVEALAEGGVDFFIIETQFSAKEAAMACDIARQTGLPIAINLTLKYTKDRKTGRVVYKTDWGHSPADLLDILASGDFSNGENLLAPRAYCRAQLRRGNSAQRAHGDALCPLRGRADPTGPAGARTGQAHHGLSQRRHAPTG